MLIGRLALAVVFILSLLLNTADGQQKSPSKRTTMQGLIDVADSCPVTLAEASYLLTEQLGAEPRYEITKETVKIINLSAREIAKVIVGFSFEGGGGRGMITVRAGPVAIGETYTLVSSGSRQSPGAFRTEYIRGTQDYHFFVRVLGVELADGTHWIKPRTTLDKLNPQALHRQTGPLTIQQCQAFDRAYQATVIVNEDHVAAYRLGVVKDTPDDFAVRLGRWVPLPRAARDKGNRFLIKASDEKISLAQAELFALEEQIAVLQDNSRIAGVFAGVALFVAEVEFADGAVWRQDLQRNELLWSEVRQ